MDLFRKVISTVEKPNFYNLMPAFKKESEIAEIEGRLDDALMLKTFSMVCHLGFDPDNKLKPFKPVFFDYQNNTRSTDIDDFDDMQLQILTDVLPEIEIQFIRCRIADILWCKKRDHTAAEIAINTYLDLSEHYCNVGELHDVLPMIERAIRIIRHARKEDKRGLEILDRFAFTCDPLNNDNFFFLSKILKMLLTESYDKFAEYAARCRIAANAAKSCGAWHWEEDFYILESNFYRKLKQKEDERNALILAANTLERRGDSCIGTEHKDYMSAASWFAQAIESYRRIANCKDMADSAHKKLIDAQSQIPNTLTAIEGPTINLSESVEYIQNALMGKSFFDALLTLAFSFNPPDYKKEKKRAEELISKFPLQSIFKQTIIASDGRTTGIVPSIHSNSIEEQEMGLWAQTLKNVKMLHLMHVEGVIKPGISQLLLEHDFKGEDFFEIVSHNPFVPPEREYLFSKGLLHGMYWDWPESVHLLIPQIENSIRYILSQYGIIISSYDSQGIQDADTLKKLLDHPKLIEIIGSDIVNDLQVILIDRFGYNLRNNMAHGLIDTYGFYSSAVIYLWWLALRLCMIPHMNHKINQAKKMKSNTKVEPSR